MIGSLRHLILPYYPELNLPAINIEINQCQLSLCPCFS